MEIKLTETSIAILDDDDYNKLYVYYWYLAKNGYAMRRINPGYRTNKRIYMHHEVLNFPNIEIDHKNGNKLDNRKSNLRICTSSQNKANQKLREDNRSGFKGVCWHEGGQKWMARIQVNNHNIYLGLYNDIKEAACVYDLAAVQYFGEFARLNFN